MRQSNRSMLTTVGLFFAALFLLTNLVHATDKAAICHVPPGNPANAHAISPDSHSYSGHFQDGKPHGLDFLIVGGTTCPPYADETLIPAPTSNPSIGQTETPSPSPAPQQPKNENSIPPTLPDTALPAN